MELAAVTLDKSTEATAEVMIMSAQKPPDEGHLNDDQETWPEPDAEELRLLAERLEELRAEGILSGAAGPRQSLPPVAYRPGALKRFLDERG